MILQQLAEARRQGRPMGIYSVCSAHDWVLEAACDQAVQDGSHLLIEATSNQVNHRGGYTGMSPAQFLAMSPHANCFATTATATGSATTGMFLRSGHPWKS